MIKGWWVVFFAYQARYCPKGSYVTANIGNNPSYIWRSILEAKHIVMQGLRRSVGSGTAVHFN